ncbi:MAG: TIGR03560 family F420-dependent LLM class oxidoreductase [Candidatus Bathyarchaeota archaeon]|nr:TIGR03560 family F420-dependent LLM class oxidoreductase [Candidatus Bathyarchaeota archaeon]
MKSLGRVDFGLQIEPQYGFSYEGIRGIAAESEKLGFESLWVSDHFFLSPESAETPCLECWTTLAALARDTSRLHLGAMVASQSYRNPALLAKMAASIDNLSGGRLNFGVGAGWKEVEYRAYGYPFPSPDTRIRQLNDSLEIAKRMWTEERATYVGKYYKVSEALCAPKPVQKPYPPIWIGGTGSFTLKISARHADAVNFAWTIPIKQIRSKLEEFKGYCETRGRDYSRIRKSAGLMITIAEDEDALKEKLMYREAHRNTPYMRYLSKQPANLVGTTEQVAARMREYIGLGIDHFILRFHYGEEIEGMRLFTEEVRPFL